MLNNIKSQYENLENKPSDAVWDKLDCKLNSEIENQNTPLQRNVKAPSKWLRYAAVAVLLLTLANIIWMLNPKETSQKVMVKDISQPKIKSVEAKGNSELEPIIKTQTVAAEYPKVAQNNINLKANVEQPNPQINDKVVNNAILPSSTKPEVELKEKVLASQTTVKNIEKPRYINASDLLFSAELEQTKKEQSASSKSKLGVNDLKKTAKDQNNFSPKSLKIFGITVYENDSLIQK